MCIKHLCQCVVGEGRLLVLGLYGVGEALLDAFCRHFLALVVGDAERKALFQRDGAEVGLQVFAVRHARHRGNVESRGFCHFALAQRHEEGVIASEKEQLLVAEDVFHHPCDGVVPLLQKVDESLRIALLGA